MSVSITNSNSHVTPPVQPVAPQASQASDSDHDGDSDVGGRVRAATPRGVGGLVDKDA
jgi:hypothetical protein